jgi:hypothetical protein
MVEAYQDPAYFLKRRGLLETAESNSSGLWYRLTQDGKRRAAVLAKRSTRSKDYSKSGPRPSAIGD